MQLKKILFLSLWCSAVVLRPSTAGAQTWRQLDHAAVVRFKAGQLDTAVELGKQALAQAKIEFGRMSKQYCSSIVNLSLYYRQKRDYKDDIPILVELVAVSRQVYGQESTRYADALTFLGETYYELGEYKKAEPPLEEALPVYQKMGVNNSFALWGGFLGLVYTYAGDYGLAKPLLLEMLALKKKIFGEDSEEYLENLNALAGLYRFMGDYNTDIKMSRELLAARKKISGMNSPAYATALEGLGIAYSNMSVFNKSEPILLEACALQQKLLGTENAEYATSLSNLGKLYFGMQDLPQAESYEQQALTIQKKLLGPLHPDYNTSLMVLANIYTQMGNYRRAEPLYQQALQVFADGGAKSANYATCLNNLAAMYRASYDYEKAEPLFEQALAICEKTSGVKSPYYVNVEVMLASCELEAGEYKKAEPLLIKGVELQRDIWGRNSSEYAAALDDLGVLYIKMGDYAAATPLLTESVRIQEKKGKNDIFGDATALFNLAGLYQAMGQPSKAAPVVGHASDLLKQLITAGFSFLSEKEKEDYIQHLLYYFSGYQSFYYNNYLTEPSLAGEAYNLELETKGMVLSSQQTLLRAVRTAGDTEQLRLLNRWQVLKGRLASEYGMPYSVRPTNIDSLDSITNIAEKELIRSAASLNRTTLLPQANWKDVQRVLKGREVAIEFSSFKYHNNRLWTDTVMYNALIIRKTDPRPILVHLCRQDELDALLEKPGNTQKAFISDLYRQPTKIFPVQNGTAQKLYDLVWKPLKPYLKPGDHIDYAVSGSLHGLALAAVAQPDGALLSDVYRLTRLSSTAVLLNPPVLSTNPGRSVVAYGGINYDTPLNKLKVATRADTRHLDKPAFSSDTDRGAGGFGYLPGTLEEIASIDSLAKLHCIPVKEYTGDAATEESFKQQGGASSPAIIHLATHAFFFPASTKRPPSNAMDISGSKLGDPDGAMSRAGLLLAGGQFAWAGGLVPQGRDDGILTAAEVANVPLPNTGLVVLSACETGLGEINGNEGVFGLQRAFKLAGAEYLLVTLWRVPDEETAEFMKEFYRYLFSGMDVPDAFTTAQERMKNKYRDEPYKWAAFELIR